MSAPQRITLGAGAQCLVTAQAMLALRDEVVSAVAAHRPILLMPGEEMGRFFCGGFDLAALAEAPAPQRQEAVAALLDFTRSLFLAPVPVVALAQGHAVGVGVLAVLAADLTLLHPKAKLRFPEVILGVGLFDDAAALLRYRAGGAMAERMICRGEAVSADAAVTGGLATRAEAMATETADVGALLAEAAPGRDIGAWAEMKLLCRAGVLQAPVARQLDRFMPRFEAALQSASTARR